MLLLNLLLFSCAQDKIEGIWEIAYSTNEKNTFGQHGSTLMHFVADTVLLVQIGDPETVNIDKVIVSSHHYIKKGSNIEIVGDEGNFNLFLELVTQDSIVYKIDGDKMAFVAKRLNDFPGEQISKSELVGKMFELKNGEFTYKLDFYNDSILFNGGYQSRDYWNIVSYDDFDFLSTTDWFFPKAPIIKRNGVLFALTNKGAEVTTFIEVKPIRDLSGLIGHWIEDNRDLYPPIPFSEDTLQSLRITEDSLTVQRFNKVKTFSFNLNKEGTVIYFPSYQHEIGPDLNQKTPMEILELSDGKLTIQEWNRGDRTTITYKKLVTDAKNP